MRAIPFFLTIAILIGGVIVAYQTFNSDTGPSGAVVDRPTVTPRPWPTSPPRTPAPTFAADPFQARGTAQVGGVQELQPPVQPTQGVSGSPSPIPSPVAPATVSPAAEPTQTSRVTPQPTSTVSPTNQASFMVGNTGGEGVYMRATPRMDDKLKPWPDNTPMVIIGPREVGDDHMWEHVRAPDGSEGYIPAEYLVGTP